MRVKRWTVRFVALAALGANAALAFTLTQSANAQCGVGGGGGPAITSASLAAHGGNAVLAVLIVIVAACGGLYVYWNERRLRAGELVRVHLDPGPDER